MNTRTWSVRGSALVLAVMGMVSVSAQGKPGSAAERPASGRAPKTTQMTRLAGTAQGPIAVPLRFDHYYTYEQVGEALKALQAAYPTMATLDVVGKSDEGRDIWGLTVNNPKTGPATSKPGVYVDGAIHGNELQATEVCLYLVNQLLTKYGENDQITRVVDRNVFYVVPSVNVDGRAHFFQDANTVDSNRSMRVPRDDDRDGLVDEDPPDDLDGDGNITTMRKRDPFGRFKTDSEEPRLMVPVKPGEKGEWTVLGDEGLDNDGDGRVNEDAEGYLDGNRNWGMNWAPPYVQTGSGEYPFSSSTTRAVAKYVVDRPNIVVVFAFHNNGGMFLRGPSTKAGEPMHARDVAVYDVIGQAAEKIVPGYRYIISWKDLYSTYGDFTDFADAVLGSYGFVGELFMVESETYRKAGDVKPTVEGDMMDFMGGGSAQDRERLKFNDHVVQGELYRPWKPFVHPQYGDIEIGGWVKMSSRLPHPFMLPDLVHRNAAAVLFAAEQTPDISLEIFATEQVSADLYKVRVRLVNAGVLPTLSYSAVQKKSHPLDTLRVSGTGVMVVSGGVLLDQYKDVVTYKDHRPEVQFLQMPGSSKIDYQFLVSGKGPITVTYESVKGGKKTASSTLK